LFEPVQPWPFQPRETCNFYHCFDFPDGSSIENGARDLRGLYAGYIGDCPVHGKTVLDVGTATGFLAFSAEEAGAAQVTALDAKNAMEFQRVPFQGTSFTDNREVFIKATGRDFDNQRAGFWHAWHRKNSRVEMVYEPLAELWRWDRRFNVITAGAIVEHLPDPVSFIGAIGPLATEAVVIGAAPIIDSDDLFMSPLTPWNDARFAHAWWALSRGLFDRVFNNLGFSTEYKPCVWIDNDNGQRKRIEATTIVARR
jgi:SAM-dependent methyltransferase